MKRLLVLSVVALGSCASPAPKTMALPDGRVANMAYCDGNSDSFATCYNVASVKCGGQFEVIDKQERSDVSGAAVSGVGASLKSMTRREIAYLCKPS